MGRGLDVLAAWGKKWRDLVVLIGVAGPLTYASVVWAVNHFDAKTNLTVGLICHHVNPSVILWEGEADPKAAYERVLQELRHDPYSHPTYLLELDIINTPEIEGVRVRMTGLKKTMPWAVASTAFPLGAYDQAKIPTQFPPSPEGVFLPPLPTLGPKGLTTLRTVASSDDRDLCDTDWVTVTASRPALEPIVGRELGFSTGRGIVIRGPSIPFVASLLVVALALLVRYWKRVGACWRAFVGQEDQGTQRIIRP